MKARLIALIALVLIAIGIYLLFRLTKGEPGYVVTRQDIILYVAAPGRIGSDKEIEVGSKIYGKIKEIRVDEGDDVNQGDIIAVLEHDEIVAQIREAEARKDRLGAELALAKLNLDRLKELIQKGAVSQAELDEATTKYDVLSCQLKEVEAHLKYLQSMRENAFIRAPISGKIIKRFVDEGEIISVQNQRPIVSLVDTASKIVIAQIDETDITKISLGQEVNIRAKADQSRSYNGVIKKIAPAMQAKTYFLETPQERHDVKVLEVKIAFNTNCPLPYNTPVEVYSSKKVKEDAIAVPLSYIHYEGDKPYVMVVGSSTQKRYVKLGVSDGEVVEIIEGLSEGERIEKR